MRKSVLLSVVTSVLVLLAACNKIEAPPDINTATVREDTRFSGQGAEAYVTSTKGGIVTYAYVSAFESKTKQPGGPETLAGEAYIYFGSYNESTGEGYYREGYTNDADFSINKKLTSASLTAMFEACSYSDDDTYTCKPATITMSWTGEGKLTRGRYNSQVRTPSFTVKETFKGTSRGANAVGEISFGRKTIELNSSTGDGYASLHSGKSRTVLTYK